MLIDWTKPSLVWCKVTTISSRQNLHEMSVHDGDLVIYTHPKPIKGFKRAMSMGKLRMNKYKEQKGYDR